VASKKVETCAQGPKRTKVIGGNILGTGHMILNSRIDRIKLSPRLRVQKHIERLGDTLEETIIVGTGGRTGLLVRVMTEDFSSMGYSDVILRG